MNILVFDIETVPDTEAGEKVLNLKNLNEKEIIKAMEHSQFQKSGSMFQPLHLHKIVAISVLHKTDQKLSLLTLGDKNSSEKEILKQFFDGIDRYQPQLVSWNGKGFDAPVIHYRALFNKVSSLKYWDKGEDDKDFKWNNYHNRFHDRHLDLMPILSGYNKGAPLTDIAQLIGAAGKFGIDGSKVTEYFLNGKIEEIRNYCETDVINTYFIFLRYLLITSSVSQKKYDELLDEIFEHIKSSDKEHWKEFCSNCNTSLQK